MKVSIKWVDGVMSILKGFEEVFDKLEPKSSGQADLKDALNSSLDLVGVFGPSGTGKSLFSLLYGVQSIARGEYKKLVLARPVIDVVTGGEITVSSDPDTYRRLAAEYLDDILGGFLGVEKASKILESEAVYLVDPHFLRGRTFDDSIIIVDDAQSVPPEALVEIITRLGNNSRLVIIGDPVFQRTMGVGMDGASMAREILSNEPTAVVVDLGLKDIVRPGARRGVKMLIELQLRKRELNPVEGKVVEAARVYAPDADVITAVDLQDAKKRWDVTSEHVPDVLVVVKEGHLGRFIGKGGERISSIEEDTSLRLRAIELTLDLKEIVRAIHPVSWMHKHVLDFDFAGPQLRVRVAKGYLGPMLGQRGSHVRFLDEVLRSMLGVGVLVEEVEQRRGRRGRR
ncbi:MAG: PhoH family protein [Aeropyrum sp.]|nr:PhoH family protein [Aeropyrum sp.]